MATPAITAQESLMAECDRREMLAREAAGAAVRDYFEGSGGFYAGPMTTVYLAVTAALRRSTPTPTPAKGEA